MEGGTRFQDYYIHRRELVMLCIIQGCVCRAKKRKGVCNNGKNSLNTSTAASETKLKETNLLCRPTVGTLGWWRTPIQCAISHASYSDSEIYQSRIKIITLFSFFVVIITRALLFIEEYKVHCHRRISFLDVIESLLLLHHQRLNLRCDYADLFAHWADGYKAHHMQHGTTQSISLNSLVSRRKWWR